MVAFKDKIRAYILNAVLTVLMNDEDDDSTPDTNESHDNNPHTNATDQAAG